MPTTTAGAPVVTGWPAALDAFGDHLRTSGRARSTRTTHLSYLQRIARDHAWLSPWSVTPDHVAVWLSRLPSAAYGRRAAGALRLFYAWAVRAGHVDVSPAAMAAPSHRPGATREGQAVRVEFPELWIEPVAAFLAYQRAAGGADRSGAVYRTHLAALARLEADPWAVTTAGLVEWLAGRELRPESRKSVRTALRSFYGWAARTGRVAASPAAELPAVRIPASVPRPVTDEALTTALSVADDKTRLMVCLGAFAGLRNAEIAAVHPRDLGEGRLYVTGKGGRGRVVPVHPVLGQEVADELARRRAGGHGTGFRYASSVTVDGFLFPSLRGGHVTADTVHRAISAVLPPGWTPHKLRHRFATRAYLGCRDIWVVGRLLGHSNPATTVRYTAVPDEALTAAVFAI